MLTDQYINNSIQALKVTDDIDFAINYMEDCQVHFLPVLNGLDLVNYVELNQLYNLNDSKMSLSDLPLYAPVLPFLTLGQHLMSVLAYLKSMDLPLLAVLNEAGEYLGLLQAKDIGEAMSKSLSIKQGGSILVIKIKPQDYALSELSRVIEYAEAKIIGLLIFEIEGQEDLELHVKLNTSSLANCLSALERHGYHVAQYFNREDSQEDLDSRYANLMKFIDL
jgi:hypothetical protein